ncbi:hypothetical protein HPB47_024516 [Ixodes persulcatus]|uniref:Uncharacterized protein n=1 Tax=Ixodes persulcatus TaxID=34615 RepID=A0AC60Q4M6_IXOPE|nr:hypothetical protein HPB47_024516 [Ixodes persulcatus]
MYYRRWQQAQRVLAALAGVCGGHPSNEHPYRSCPMISISLPAFLAPSYTFLRFIPLGKARNGNVPAAPADLRAEGVIASGVIAGRTSSRRYPPSQEFGARALGSRTSTGLPDHTAVHSEGRPDSPLRDLPGPPETGDARRSARESASKRRCFNTPLEPRALQDLKAIVEKNLEGGVERDGLTLDGFLFLHMVFIQRGRHETTWTVLRKFGYDDQLVLPREYLCPPIRVPPGSSAELSSKGFQFVTALFEKHDQASAILPSRSLRGADEDGCLSPVELRSLFGVCPCSPWAPDLVGTVATDHRGWLTLQGYLAHWALTTALDVHKTFECLAYLGYLGAGEESQLSAVQVTWEKQLEVQQRQTSRQVLHCHVLGPQGAGKTSFLRGLLGCGLDRGSHPASKYAVDRLPVYGQDKYLLLHEVDLFGQHDAPVTPELHCDAVCLLFDASNPRSFEHVARAYLVSGGDHAGAVVCGVQHPLYSCIAVFQ